MYNHNLTKIFYFPERITEAMNRVFLYPLTILEAPMGYGKTTTVKEHLVTAHANILWQKIHDNSSSGFWYGFCQTFRKTSHDLAHHLEQLGLPNDSTSQQEALQLIREMVLPEKTVYVIDDYHLMNKIEVNRFIEFLTINEIEHLHIVLVTRYIEYLSIEELSLKGYLTYITKETFEFLPNEIRKYYRLCGVTLTLQMAEQLFSMTEGWISALYLLMFKYDKKCDVLPINNIHKLIDTAIYRLFSEELKLFLLTMSIYDSFTKE